MNTVRCNANKNILRVGDFSLRHLPWLFSLSTRVVLIRPTISTWDRRLYPVVDIIQSYLLCHLFFGKVLLYNSNHRLYLDLDLRSKILICEAKNATVNLHLKIKTKLSILEAFKVIKSSPLAVYRICTYFRRYMKFKAQFRLHAILPFFER